MNTIVLELERVKADLDSNSLQAGVADKLIEYVKIEPAFRAVLYGHKFEDSIPKCTEHLIKVAREKAKSGQYYMDDKEKRKLIGDFFGVEDVDKPVRQSTAQTTPAINILDYLE